MHDPSRTGDPLDHLAAQADEEVADRLEAIGRVGAHLRAGELAARAAVGTAEQLLAVARTWVL